MRKCKAFLVIVGLASMVLLSSQVKNSDAPKKGDWDPKIKLMWRAETAGENPLVRVFPLKVHDNGNVYVMDQKFSKISIFNPQGKFIKSFGKRGEGPGEFKHVMDIHLLKDRFILVDMGQILIYSLDGVFEKSFKIRNQTGTNPLFFIDATAYLYTPSDPRVPGPPDSIEIFDVSKQSKKVLLDLSPGDEKELPGGGGRMVMIRIGGGDLQRRTGMVVGYDGKSVFYGHNDNYRITEIDLSGKKIMDFSVANRPLNQITQAFKEKMVGRMQIRIQGGPSADDVKKRIIKSIPDVCTYFWRIQKLANGLILVYASDIVREDGLHIDIFSSKGEYLYKMDIKVPQVENLNPTRAQIAGSFLYAFYEDSGGDNHLAKFQIHLPNN